MSGGICGAGELNFSLILEKFFRSISLRKEDTYMQAKDIIQAAWNRKEPDSMDFAEEKLYWAMRSICFLYTSGDISKEAASEAKTRLVASYQDFRTKWARWASCQAAYKMLLTSTNPEAQRIASEMKQLFFE